MKAFTGIYAFPITPMDVDGRVDGGALRRLVRRLVEAGVDGVGLLGSTGSYPYLSREERRRALDAALIEVDGRLPVVAGIGALRTDHAMNLAEDARASGAGGGLLAAVSYTPLLDDEVMGLFEAVAGAVDLPLVIYNNPGTTHFTMSPDLIGRLSNLPGVVALKDPAADPARAGEALAALRAVTPPGFSVGFSGDWNATAGLIAGADAWYSVVAGLFPRPVMDIRRAVARGDMDEARALDERLEPLWALFKRYTSLRTIYAAAHHLGLTDAQPPLPIQPLSSEAQGSVSRVLEQLDLH